jgi:hypothetical protein
MKMGPLIFTGSMEANAATVSDDSELGQKAGLANTGFNNDGEGKNNSTLTSNLIHYFGSCPLTTQGTASIFDGAVSSQNLRCGR